MRLTAKAARGDAGFTLIELLLVVIITGIIVVPLGDALIMYFRNTDATAARISLSHDAEISAAYVASDVAGVGLRDLATTGPGGTIPFKSSIQLNAAYDAGGQVCGTPVTPAARIRLLADGWDTSTSPASRITRIVAYYLAPAGAVSELHRLACAGSTTTDIVIAHDVDASTFQVTCDGSPTACEGTTVPQTVQLAFTARLLDANGQPTTDPYPITLIGHRRQQ